ncbi:hypothetical protein Tco_1290864 [Tanacetum coccineum]
MEELTLCFSLTLVSTRKSSVVSSSHSMSLATPSQMNVISQSSNIQQRDPMEPSLHSIQSKIFPKRVSSNQFSTFILLRLLSIRALGGVKLETYELNVKHRLPPIPRVCGLYIYSSLPIIASLDFDDGEESETEDDSGDSEEECVEDDIEDKMYIKNG